MKILEQIVKTISNHQEQLTDIAISEFDGEKTIDFSFSERRVLSIYPDKDSNDWLYVSIGNFDSKK